MTRAFRHLVPAAAICAAAAGCKDSAGPSGTIAVVVSTTPSTAAPGTPLTVTVTATPSGGASIDRLVLTASGLITSADTTPGQGSAAMSVTRSFVVPAQTPTGRITFSAVAQGPHSVKGTGEAVLDLTDTQKPVTLQLTATPARVGPGDTLTVSYIVTDNFGLKQTELRLSGGVTASDVQQYGYARYGSRTVKFVIAQNAPLNTQVVATLVTEDAGGQRDSTSAAPIALLDYRPPTITGSLAEPPGGTTYFAPGQQVTLQLDAVDNLRLTWIGYRLGPPAQAADSFAVSAASASRTLSFAIPASWTGTSAVHVFARDGSGNLTDAALGGITVRSGTHARSIREVLTGGESRDAAYSVSRDAVYLAQPGLQRVGVVSVTGGSFSTLALRYAPSSLDVSPSGDTLVVAMRAAHSLAVADLRQASPTLQYNALQYGTGSDQGPNWTRLAANRKVIMSITFSGSGYGGSVMEYDLSTGIQRARTDTGLNGGLVTEAVPLARSGDGSKILMLIDDSCCPELAHVYDAATDSWTPERGTVSRYFPTVAADWTGSRFLIGGTLFDPALRTVSFAPPASYAGGPSALGPSQFGVFTSGSGFLVVRLSDGALLDTVALSFQPVRLLALPDGGTVVAVGADRVAIVTLW